MKVKASQAKAQFLSLIERVHRTGEEVVITKRGRPIARLIPEIEAAPAKVFGCMEGTLTIADANDDLLSTGEKWNAEH